MFGILGFAGLFAFLGFIVILVILIVFIALTFLGNILRSIFGLGKRTPKHFYGEKTNTTSETGSDQTYSQSTSTPSGNKKKIFTEDEGEYVEFEEVQ